ncbi:MAG TPA: beta-ketoacyl-ACP synthase II [Blastocatellia bacterium]|nr:beta-ketoacyl-ACP synthase II [Blastocatellia bacterium]HMV83849.1 beta-ketoacyl-ACP synthase II [Blastocatellia bacterium]HMX27313.1 beta-ketoacyl-ACP synthase II [Blastocatellia bacterium]HMY75299.1 beta-ketoacyl-ACP synthase II [Blastocatellia bacterium]HNG31902.1 beta-ketoacyl-ACP synthase II [Blastocatellia bacterium]
MSNEITKKRVVVTGIGLISPLGNTTENTWVGLLAGRSGVDYIARFDTSQHKVKFAAETKGFDPLKFIEKKELKKMDYFIYFAIAAAREALEDSGLQITGEKAEDIGVYIGSGIGGFGVFEREHTKMIEGGPDRISPFFIPASIVNLASGYVSIYTGAKGPNSATATACSSGAHAIGDSFRIIQRGEATAMICGGSEGAITPMSVGGFAAMRALSTRNDDPQHASRPFDKDRDGFVIGEGAGILILEELEHAKARGAKIYGEIVGYGMTSDAFHITLPDMDGPRRVMLKTVKDAGISPEQVDYINVHGTSTPAGDVNETNAIKAAFGEHAYKLAASSTKSMTGHLLGGAGGLEAGITVLAVHHQMLPPTINYDTPDPECDLDYVPNQARPAKVTYALSNSFGFGGTNAALLIKRYEN